MQLSIIIPALNEERNIANALNALQSARARGCEVIVVDGGSSDLTVTNAKALADSVIHSPTGRAIQMNAGAAAAAGATFLFLHADSTLPPEADQLILDGLRESGSRWGRFEVSIEGQHIFLPVVAWFMNRRSRLTGIATGDQGLFMTAEAFKAAGGFPAIPLMEDVAMCKALKQQGTPLCLSEKIVTSGRRWEKHGVWRTILLMWRIRLAYFFGTDPAALHRAYHGGN